MMMVYEDSPGVSALPRGALPTLAPALRLLDLISPLTGQSRAGLDARNLPALPGDQGLGEVEDVRAPVPLLGLDRTELDEEPGARDEVRDVRWIG